MNNANKRVVDYFTDIPVYLAQSIHHTPQTRVYLSNIFFHFPNTTELGSLIF